MEDCECTARRMVPCGIHNALINTLQASEISIYNPDGLERQVFQRLHSVCCLTKNPIRGNVNEVRQN